MNQPAHIPGARICVLLHPDETVVCANVAGFQEIGGWISWLAQSNPDEGFHFHMLWHCESEASRFDGVLPKNIWVLRTPTTHQVKVNPPEGMDVVDFDITFQVATESQLDELAAAQESGVIPPNYRKEEASYVADCG